MEAEHIVVPACCPSCGVQWVDHLGISGTCRDLLEAKKTIAAAKLPDAKDWTEDDWRDLHKAIESVKRKVAARHAKGNKP